MQGGAGEKEGTMKLKLFILLTMVALAFFGCTKEEINDAGITTKVKSQLAADTQTSAIKIAVDTTNRVVTLSGVVPTEKEKSRAEQIARTTEGVAQVVNNITVNPDSLGATNVKEKAEEAAQSAGAAANKVVADAEILSKIKTKLLVEGITGTNVDVKNGDVTIKGEVKNARQVEQAMDIIRSTDGVKNVNNQLTAKEK
jgi:osmotically-inducible protein OsmY